jgi:predicted RNA-binding Zn ribbon-like protein
MAIDSYLKPKTDTGGPALAFVNGPELLDDLPRLRRLLRRWDTAPEVDPTPAQLAKLRRLRETLRQLGEIVAEGRLPSDEELAPLNRFLAEVPVAQQLLAGDDRILVKGTALASGWDEVIRDVAGWFAIILVRYEPSRLHLCGNPDCERLFYDTS